MLWVQHFCCFCEMLFFSFHSIHSGIAHTNSYFDKFNIELKDRKPEHQFINSIFWWNHFLWYLPKLISFINWFLWKRRADKILFVSWREIKMAKNCCYVQFLRIPTWNLWAVHTAKHLFKRTHTYASIVSNSSPKLGNSLRKPIEMETYSHLCLA